MSGICGWLGAVPDNKSPAAIAAAMAGRLTCFDGTRAHTEAGAWGSVSASALNAVAEVWSDHQFAVAVCGRPHLRGNEVSSHPASLAPALARAYESRGAECLAGLSGTFALAILDHRAMRALLAVDRMAVEPLAFAVHENRLVFGSTLKAIGNFPGIESRIDHQAIYDYLHFHMIPAPRTIYQGRHKMLGGHYLEWHKGQLAVQAYWKPKFIEDRGRPFSDLKAEFITRVRESVRDAAGAGSNTGCFLSGGTDSSTIAGLLGQVSGRPARTYSIGFAEPGYDEMEYARIAANHFHTDHHEYYVTPDDVVEAIPKIARLHDQPFGNSSAVPTYYCAKLARDDGVSVMLGGDGGDELFGGNARYATQYILSLYGELPHALRKGFIEPFAALFPEKGVIGKAQRYIRYASTPMPARYDNYNLLDRLGPENVLAPEFLASVNTGMPKADMAKVYESAAAHSLINRMLAYDFKYTLADNDLPKVARSCELAGVGVGFPLIADCVVNFSMALQPELKLRRTQLRYFFKRALADFLPPEIIRKQKHGFGLPFGPWSQRDGALREIAVSALTDIRKRRIVRPDFMTQLTSARMKEHAGYYGTMVWLLMMLEYWLAEHHASL